MIEAGRHDAVFVVNHQTPAAAIARACAARSHRDVLLIGTQHFFTPERTALEAQLAPARVTFTSVADLLDDAALAAVDDATSADLQSSPPRHGQFSVHFELRARTRKNAALLAALRAAGLPPTAALHAAHGLGLDARVWQDAGAILLPPHLGWRETLRTLPLWQAAADTWHRGRARPRTALRVRDGDQDYLFAASLRRLPIADGIAPETLPRRDALTASPRACVAVGLHDYTPGLHDFGRPVRVFVDGYLPPNYPRTYLDGLRGAEFVCPEPLSAEWLQHFDQPLLRPPGFLAPREFSPARAPAAPATLLILLGHAGDWSSLINRSDNDRLVATGIDTARLRPAWRVILRAHPTMEHPRHEGAGARARITAAVAHAARPNLSLSTARIEDDLAQADVCAAEYSAALIDAWRVGKPGLAINVTTRRSFMPGFADLGFAHATGTEEFVAALDALRSVPAEFAARQSAAAARYNARQRDHLARLA